MAEENAPMAGRPAGWMRTLGSTIVGLIYFFPVIWMILAAFKTRADSLATPPSCSSSPTLEHFWAIFHRLSADGARVFDTGLDRNFANSLVHLARQRTLALGLGAGRLMASRGFARRGRDY